MNGKIKCPKCGWGSTVRYIRSKGIFICFHCGNEFPKENKKEEVK
jgi:ribosomal protein L37AE/L43A